MTTKTKTEKLSYGAFFVKAIQALRTPGFEGVLCHKVNTAFRAYYPGVDPVEVSKDLEVKGVIHTAKVKRGLVMLFVGPKQSYDREKSNPGASLLAQMGL